MPPPMAAGGEPSPGAAPAMSPQKPRGDQAQGKAKLQMAIRIMEDALPKLGSDSAEGKAVLKAITALVKVTGPDEERSQQILPAELKSALMDNPAAPPGGGGPPPGGGGPPGGAPPPGM